MSTKPSLKNRAFTLIELLVVIAIIAMLSSVVLASLNGARAKARDAQRGENLVQIRNALNLYASDNSGNYPVGNYLPANWGAFQTVLSQYMSVLPTDPLNDATHEYFYTNSFVRGWITNQAEGTCFHKSILVAIGTEGGGTRRDCTLDAGAEEHANEIVILIN